MQKKNNVNQDQKYDKLTPRLAKQLAAPHTWTASCIPAVFGALLAFSGAGAGAGDAETLRLCLRDPGAWIAAALCLLAAILMQSAVNTINDYYDFVHGTDTLANSDKPDDAALVYNNLRPRSVYALGISFMAAAAALGIYPAIRGGMAVLVTGILGFAIIMLYSAGPRPLSAFPVGEFFSGVVMGAGISIGTYFSVCGGQHFSATSLGFVLLMSAPHVIGIALIMLANNTCDIERDRETGRHTLAVALGRRGSEMLYRCLASIWLVLAAALAAHFFGLAAAACTAAVILAAMFKFYKLFTISRVPENRWECMILAAVSNTVWNGAYCLAPLILIIQSGLS